MACLPTESAFAKARPLRLPLKGGVILLCSSVADNPQGTAEKPWIGKIAVIPAEAGIHFMPFVFRQEINPPTPLIRGFFLPP